MELTMDIALSSMDYSLSKVQSEAAVSALQKAMDTGKDTATSILDMLPKGSALSAQTARVIGLGRFVNARA